MKGRQIIKRHIVSLSEAAEIGRIDNVVFDRQARMAALVIKRGARQKEALSATAIGNVHALGRDVVTISESEAVEGPERVEELRSFPNLRQLLGCRVITDGGTYLGTVRDIVLDAEERRITSFDLKGRGVLGRLRGDTIPATGHLRFGKEIVVVPNAVTLKGRAVMEQIVAEPVAQLAPVSLFPESIAVSPSEAAKVAAAEGGSREEVEEGGLTRALGA